MSHVSKVWYRLYAGFMLAVDICLGGAWLLGHFVARFGNVADSLHVTHTMLVIAGLQFIYMIALYVPVARKSKSLASVIGAMIFSLIPMYGLLHNGSITGRLIFVGIWTIAVFMDGMYGLPLLLGSMLLSDVYILVSHDFIPTAFGAVSWIYVAATTIAMLVAYLFWKRRYIDLAHQQVTQLSGMLRSNQEQSEILIQSIADGVIVFSTDGKISLINPAAAAMTEWPIAEAEGVDAQIVAKLSEENGTDIPVEDNPFATVLTEQQHINRTVVLTGRAGKKQTVSLVVSPVVEPVTNKPVGAVAVMRDISEEREAEKQRADFISTASHEMRTPVAAIEGYLALALNEKVSTIDNRARAYLEKAHTSTQHLGKLFQDLLTSSKAEDGRLTSHPSVVEMGAFMQQLTDDLKFAAEKKGLFAEFVIGSSETIDATAKDVASTHTIKPLYYVLADADRMREVITNLFDNACKYTEQGKISIGLTGNTDVVQMYVRDTGNGIPAEDIPHLFQKFYRVDNSATRTIGGTGLGLFICRKIVELYHGRIWVESELGKGSTFFINLPRLTTQRASELQEKEASTVAEAVSAPAPIAQPAPAAPSPVTTPAPSIVPATTPPAPTPATPPTPVAPATPAATATPSTPVTPSTT